jgi:hypothetical protein
MRLAPLVPSCCAFVQKFDLLVVGLREAVVLFIF